MDAVDFKIGQGMTAPDLAATLTNPDGTAINLDTEPPPTVTFTMRRESQLEPIVTGTATIVDPDGQVAYPWTDGDTDVPGRYRGYFTVAYDDGEVVRFPADDLHIVIVAA